MNSKFSTFGLGRDGIPSFFREWFESGELEAADLIQRTSDQSDDTKTLALLLAEFHGNPPHILQVLSKELGLTSTGQSGLPVPSANARKAAGLPARLNKFREFAEAAGREAFAQALTALRGNPIQSASRIESFIQDQRADLVDLWNRSPMVRKLAERLNIISSLLNRVENGGWILKDHALEKALKQNWHFADGGTLITDNTTRKGASRQVIAGKKKQNGRNEQGWRDYPEFSHIVREVGAHLVMQMKPRPHLTDDAWSAPIGWSRFSLNA